jgi:hypothetical protein
MKESLADTLSCSLMNRFIADFAVIEHKEKRYGFMYEEIINDT